MALNGVPLLIKCFYLQMMHHADDAPRGTLGYQIEIRHFV